LATRQPELKDSGVTLGMEATDLKTLETVNRRNQSLERTNAWTTGFGKYAEHPVRKFEDDETYAKAYHHLYDETK
jgi:hypothetical protein